jgi:protocatechuate 3,4-dioxygenase beta subunit
MSGAARLSSYLAVLACLLFLLTLPPTRLLPSIFAPLTSPVPEDQLLAGELVVRVRGLSPMSPAECSNAEMASGNSQCQSAPLANATVSALWERNNQYFPVATVVSDENGQARLQRLPQGRVWLLVEAPEFARHGEIVTLAAGPEQLDVVLERAQQLTVRVVDDQKQAISAATVLVRGEDPLPFGKLTDARGQAVLQRLGHGPWQVTVAARGYERITQANVTSDITVTLRKLGGLLITVVDENQAPVAGAQVFVGGALWPARQGTTDAKGELQVGGLESGSYDLRAVHGDRVSPSVLGLFLARGEQARARLQLGPGRFVTVLVQDGETEEALPVADADVILVEQGIAPFPLQGRTNEQGKVTLGPIAVGPASVGAYAEGFIGRAAVPVPEQLEGPLVVALRRGATLKGKVVDRNDHAIGGAEIEVIGTDLDGLPIAETPWFSAMRRGHFEAQMAPAAPLIAAGELGVMPGPIPGIPSAPLLDPGVTGLEPIEPIRMGSPWLSDVDGDFRLFPVTPGRVRLIVRHDSYVETVSDPVSIEPGAEARIKVVMLEGASLIGRVLDDRDFPVAGARIELSATKGVSRHSLFTRADGTFEFKAVPSSVLLSLARPDNPVEFVLRKTLDLGNESRREIELRLPPAREAVEITLSADRQAIDLAQVVAISLDVEVPLKKTLFSDQQGHVVIPDAAGLPLRLIVETPGFADYQQTFEQAPKTLEIELQRGVWAQGKLTAVRGRQAVAGASITVLAHGQRHTTHSDSLGEYELRDLNPGEITLLVAHPEYANHEQKITVSGTGRPDRAFDLPTIDLVVGGSVHGVVVDADGNPVSGARVAAGGLPAFLPAGELPPGMARTNGQGEFTLSNLAPGAVTLHAQAVNKGRGHVEAAISEGQTTSDVRLVLQPAAETETGQTGGVAVTMSEAVAGQVMIEQVAAHSEAERAGLQVGDRVLAVEGQPVASISDARARLSGNAGTDALIELQRGGSIFKLRVTREQLRR